MAATALMAIATEARFRPEHVAFVTAYADRDASAFKASVSQLAWRSFVWFVSEPDHIVLMRAGGEQRTQRLNDLMRP